MKRLSCSHRKLVSYRCQNMAKILLCLDYQKINIEQFYDVPQDLKQELYQSRARQSIRMSQLIVTSKLQIWYQCRNFAHWCYIQIHMKLVIVLMTILALVVADSCGGNCPSGHCPTCYCGTAKSMQDIGAWCGKYSWNQACCKCVVSHESGGNANALNYNTNSSTDVGLWQINTVNWGSCSGGHAPCDPNVNLQCAIKVYQWGGNTWKLWSTHTACGC